MYRVIAIAASIAAALPLISAAQTIRDRSGTVQEYSTLSAAQCGREWVRLLNVKDHALEQRTIDCRADGIESCAALHASRNAVLRDTETRMELHDRHCNKGGTSGKDR